MPMPRTPMPRSGRRGWRDQREAMVWVQKHIAAFGGDPGRVTLMGQSAGGQSVLTHVVSRDPPSATLQLSEPHGDIPGPINWFAL
mmetsp:Transcript_60698/g.180793  ORF Transcript_60698/g.180793 Transcript_60698/m.180793 type:complete len:85 (+) Transcript_60698:440-694(+)